MDKTTIANLALNRVGEQIIMNVNDDSENAVRVRLVFDQVFEEVLRNHNWKCCTFRQKLAETTDDPVFGWQHSYQLPTNPKCVKILRISNLSSNWTKQGDKLLTNATGVSCVYIGKPDETYYDNLDASLIKVLYLSLAVELAYMFVENNTILNGLQGFLSDAWEDARFNDSSEEYNYQNIDSDTWLASRLTSSNINYNETNVR